MNARLKRFFCCFKPYRALLTLDILAAGLSAGIALVIPQLIRYTTGALLASGLPSLHARILWIGALLVVLVALKTALTYFYDYRGHAMGAMIERDLRHELFDKFQRLDYAFFDREKPGALSSRLTNDLLNLAELCHHGPEDMAIYAIQFIGALFVLLRIHTGLTLLLLAFVPVIGLFSAVVGKQLKAAFKRNLERIGEVNAMAQENLSGIRTVQAFANESLASASFARAGNDYMDSRIRIYRSEAVFYNGIAALTQLATIAVVIFGSLRMLGGTLSLPDLLAFILYISLLVEPIAKLSQVMQLFQQGIAGFNRFMDIVEMEPAIQDAKEPIAPFVPTGHVAFEHASFRYAGDSRDVLHDVSLSAAPGERIAIIGPSGIGKTTLMRLLPRFYDVTHGCIRIDGHDVRDMETAWLRRQIGVVEQDVFLFSGTIRDNIAFGKPDATMDEIKDAAECAHAHAFIEALPDGYDTEIGDRGLRLSGGQRQRLSIARAFLKNPPILILDEATSALDDESERAVQEALERLSTDRTTFIIAHRQSTIQSADRVFTLSGCDGGTASGG